LRDKVLYYGDSPPCRQKAQGAWCRSDGTFPVSKPGDKSYDASRKKVSKFLGLDALYTAKAYLKSVQTDSKGRKAIYTSDNSGVCRRKIELSDNLSERVEDFGYKFIYPRSFERCGLPNVQRKVEKLSWLTHCVTQSENLNAKVCKDLARLSLIWPNMRYDSLRKLINRITLEMSKSNGYVSRNLDAPSGKRHRPIFTDGVPVFSEDKAVFPKFTFRNKQGK